MARTFRNRRTTLKGWVVRDDGHLYKPSCCPSKARVPWARPGTPGHEKWLARFCECELERRHARRWSRWMSRERKSNRKIHMTHFRAQVRECLGREDWENIPRWRRTSGWLTW